MNKLERSVQFIHSNHQRYTVSVFSLQLAKPRKHPRMSGSPAEAWKTPLTSGSTLWSYSDALTRANLPENNLLYSEWEFFVCNFNLQLRHMYLTNLEGISSADCFLRCTRTPTHRVFKESTTIHLPVATIFVKCEKANAWLISADSSVFLAHFCCDCRYGMPAFCSNSHLWMRLFTAMLAEYLLHSMRSSCFSYFLTNLSRSARNWAFTSSTCLSSCSFFSSSDTKYSARARLLRAFSSYIGGPTEDDDTEAILSLSGTLAKEILEHVWHMNW